MKDRDLIGQIFGQWTVLELAIKGTKTTKRTWICKCTCSNVKSVTQETLLSGRSHRCRSCASKDSQPLTDFLGKKIGYWTVLSKSKLARKWFCRCECGFETDVLHHTLLTKKNPKCKTCAKVAKLETKIGEKFGKWTVVEIYEKSGQGVMCLCRCECGRESKVRQRTLHNRTTLQCRHCGSWQGVGDFSKGHFNNIVARAKKRGLEFSLTQEWLWNLYLKQDRKCAITNVPIKFDETGTRKYYNQTASLDRIDSSKGYTEDNVQWVHKAINFMKQALEQQEFIELCNLVAQQYPTKVDPESFVCINKNGYRGDL